MQNRYVGDLGDYGKYGLLRWLLVDDSAIQKLRLAVLWYLVPDETHNNDGRHIAYLRQSNSRLAECDPELFAGLARIISGGRSVSAVENSTLLLVNTQFHSAPLAYAPSERLDGRTRKREAWFSDALRVASSADLVFVDPDNGIECDSVAMHSRMGVKYAYYDDIRRLCSETTSLVLYHHLSRQGSASDQILSRSRKLSALLPDGHRLIPLRFRRGSSRVFFIVVAPRHWSHIQSRLEALASSAWAAHFERHASPTRVRGAHSS
jgi:hypothetical protein